MIPILPPTPQSSPHVIELVGVSRVLAVPTDHLPATLAGLDAGTTISAGRAGRLVFDTPFEPASTPGRWRARARVHLRGARLVPHARVELELSPWGEGASDLHVRPLARRPQAWGIRRLRRYLASAPLATEALIEQLERAWHTAREAMPSPPATVVGAEATHRINEHRQAA